MASINMHLCISKQIKEKLGLSDQFMLGCIMPDVLKYLDIPRDSTHYKEGPLDRQIGVDRYIQEYNNQLYLKNELCMGYLVHLIEDKIWFSKYCITDDMSVEEYQHKVYSFFRLADRYLIQKNQIDLEQMRTSLMQIAMSKRMEQVVEQEVSLGDIIEHDILLNLTYDDLDRLQQECIQEATKVLSKFLKR